MKFIVSVVVLLFCWSPFAWSFFTCDNFFRTSDLLNKAKIESSNFWNLHTDLEKSLDEYHGVDVERNRLGFDLFESDEIFFVHEFKPFIRKARLNEKLVTIMGRYLELLGFAVKIEKKQLQYSFDLIHNYHGIIHNLLLDEEGLRSQMPKQSSFLSVDFDFYKKSPRKKLINSLMPGFDLMVSHVYRMQKIKPEDRQDIYMDLLTTLNLDGYYMRGQNRVVVFEFPFGRSWNSFRNTLVHEVTHAGEELRRRNKKPSALHGIFLANRETYPVEEVRAYREQIFHSLEFIDQVLLNKSSSARELNGRDKNLIQAELSEIESAVESFDHYYLGIAKGIDEIVRTFNWSLDFDHQTHPSMKFEKLSGDFIAVVIDGKKYMGAWEEMFTSLTYRDMYKTLFSYLAQLEIKLFKHYQQVKERYRSAKESLHIVIDDDSKY